MFASTMLYLNAGNVLDPQLTCSTPETPPRGLLAPPSAGLEHASDAIVSQAAAQLG